MTRRKLVDSGTLTREGEKVVRNVGVTPVADAGGTFEATLTIPHVWKGELDDKPYILVLNDGRQSEGVIVADHVQAPLIAPFATTTASGCSPPRNRRPIDHGFRHRDQLARALVRCPLSGVGRRLL